jgi:hypothetical protein
MYSTSCSTLEKYINNLETTFNSNADLLNHYELQHRQLYLEIHENLMNTTLTMSNIKEECRQINEFTTAAKATNDIATKQLLRDSIEIKHLNCKLASTKLRGLRKRCDDLRGICMSISRKMVITKNKATNIEDDIRTTQFVLDEMRSRVIDKNAGISLSVLKKKFSCDILTYIGEFLPCSIYFHLIDKRYNPIKKLHSLKVSALIALSNKILEYPIFKATIHVMKHIRYNIWLIETINNPRLFTLKGIRRKVLELMYELKNYSPIEALDVYKTIAILIKPGKKYNTSLATILSK